MTWINDNKGSGPWDFEKSANKFCYNEGDKIACYDSPLWSTKFSGIPITPTHNPCGYWVNRTIYADSVISASSVISINCEIFGVCIIEDGCCIGVSIGYTTQGMSVDEKQILTVENPVAGCTYKWEITSGGGSLSSEYGVTTIYTAPSANGNCEYNPIITLGVEGADCDTLRLAVNAYGAADIGWDYSDIVEGGGFPECTQTTGTCVGCYTVKDKWCNYHILHCDGTTTPSGFMCGDPDDITYWNCTHCAFEQDCPGTCPGACVYPSNIVILQNCINTRGAEDQRTEAEKAAGCCPPQLL